MSVVATLTAQQLAILNRELAEIQQITQAAQIKNAGINMLMKMVVPDFDPERHHVNIDSGEVVVADSIQTQDAAPKDEIIVMPPGPQLVN